MRITGNLRLHIDVTTELIKSKVVPSVSHLPVESCLDLDPAKKGSRSQAGIIRRGVDIFLPAHIVALQVNSGATSYMICTC